MAQYQNQPEHKLTLKPSDSIWVAKSRRMEKIPSDSESNSWSIRYKARSPKSEGNPGQVCKGGPQLGRVQRVAEGEGALGMALEGKEA